MKKCSKCKEEKELDEFHNSSKSKDGKFTYCKECNNSRSKKSYHSNETLRNKKLENNKKYKERNRDYVYKFLLDNQCVDCNESDPVVLEFDHLGNKSYTIGNMIVNFSLEKIIKEISKCEVRCANCHRRKTARDFNYYTIQKSGATGNAADC